MLTYVQCGLFVAFLGFFVAGCGVDEAIAQTQRSGVQKKVREAIALYEKSDWKAAYLKGLPLAKQGNSEAQLLMGNLLAQGKVGPVDFMAARRWWSLAANAGNAKAQFNLGLMYQYGDGVKADTQVSRKWLAEAALGGHSTAMHKLGELLLESENPRQSAEGYMWLRMVNGEVSEPSPGGSGTDDELQGLERAALQLTLPYAHLRGSHPLGTSDRGSRMAYFITRQVLDIAGLQGRTLNTATENPGTRSAETLRDVGMKTTRLAGALGEAMPPDTMSWVFFRKGFRLDGPEAIPVSPLLLWDLVRPGDAVEIADGLNSHLTFVYAVDRTAKRIDFIDVWPRESMLLAGRNARDVKAKLRPLGKTRLLVSISKDEFISVGRGIMTSSSPRLMETVFAHFPEMKNDPRVSLAVGAILVQHFNPEVSCRGITYLGSFLVSPDKEIQPKDRAAAADRIALGLEQCRKGKVEKIAYPIHGVSSSGELSVEDVASELERRFRPTLSSLDPASLADLVSDMASRGKADGAMRLIDDGLVRLPGNEKLLVARARIHFEEKRQEMGLADIGSAITSLEAKLASRNPVINDADGNVVGAVTAKLTLSGILRQACLLRASVLLKTGRPQDGIKDALRVLRLDEYDREATGLAIQGYEALGDTDHAKALADKLKSRELETLFGRMLQDG
jgi:Sel1 repeat